MRVMVTGGAGFIGSHLVDALVERGDDVTVLDDLSAGRAARLNERTDLIVGSVVAADLVAEAFDKARPDLVYHLAAQADVRISMSAPAIDASVNVLGTVILLDLASRAGTPVVFASSGGAIHGGSITIPISENDAPEPISPYGTAKLCAEAYVRQFNLLYGTRHRILRLGNVYGPRQDPSGEAGVVSIFARSVAAGVRPVIFGDGLQTRDFVYVADVVEALVKAGRVEMPGVWNIGTGIESSLLDLLSAFSVLAGRAVKPVFRPARRGEARRSCLAIEAARRDLAYRPVADVSEGVRKTYRWVIGGASDRYPC
ncbi:NAD-dependent epimerase/dehydratase family protein [Catellatospora vulcania]|uniref:NAD-dependent epimerase/dehydratase family protein n=1 Tax=Catellatospora vulcania TaxID=1460450 RepID=UPI0012D47547|nr:NAD-dependent epimerase/dehydratase family protein [Catellatospora vulcania]